jgi:hypothetical protein
MKEPVLARPPGIIGVPMPLSFKVGYIVSLVIAHSLWVSFALIYIFVAIFRQDTPWAIIVFKPLPVYMCICITIINFIRNVGPNFKKSFKSHIHVHIGFGFLITGLIFGSVGDIFLNIPSLMSAQDAVNTQTAFLGLGIFMFVAGHICYIVTFSICSKQRSREGSFGCFCNLHFDLQHGWHWMLVLALFGAVLFTLLAIYNPSAILVALGIYIAVLCALLWKLSQAPKKRLIMGYYHEYHVTNPHYLHLSYQYLRFFGAFAFVMSDTVLSVDMFVPAINIPIGLRYPLIMGLYYIAQYMISLSFNEYYLPIIDHETSLKVDDETFTETPLTPIELRRDSLTPIETRKGSLTPIELRRGSLAPIETRKASLSPVEARMVHLELREN